MLYNIFKYCNKSVVGLIGIVCATNAVSLSSKLGTSHPGNSKLLETAGFWSLLDIFHDRWLTVEILVQTYAGCETWEACAMTKFKELSLSSSSVSSSSTACCWGFSFRTSYEGKQTLLFVLILTTFNRWLQKVLPFRI